MVARSKKSTASVADFEIVIDEYVSRLQSLAAILSLTMPLFAQLHKALYARLEDFIEKHGTELEKSKGFINYRIPPEHYAKLMELSDIDEPYKIALFQYPKNHLVALVSEIDFFLARLIRLFFDSRPEMLKASVMAISYKELQALGSYKSACDYFLEKEIESIMRCSHAEHFKWLEQQLDIPLRKDLHLWAQYIELTERRNLFTHAGGIVNSHYMSVCIDHGVKLRCKRGDQLDVSGEYAKQSFECLYEIGVKLAHVLWRKLQPENRKDADAHLNELCYRLLVKRKYALAERMLDFSLDTIKKHSSNEMRVYFLINKAIAMKWGGKKQEAKALLKKEDFSVVSNKFKLAIAVLDDRYKDAAQLMRKVSSDDFSKSDYRDFPLFRDFRTSQEFMKAYKSIYGEEFVIEKKLAKSNLPSLSKGNKSKSKRSARKKS